MLIFHHRCPACGRDDLPMIHTGPGMVRCGACRHTCRPEDITSQSLRQAPTWRAGRPWAGGGFGRPLPR